jgi:glycosyltransferase involved in cell wall biosynthesis
VLLAPLLFFLAWGLFAAYRLFISAIRGLLFPLRILDRLVRRLQVPRPDPQLARDEAGCDVWLIPYVGLDYALTTPSVLVIHDLVYVHFPDTFADPAVARRLDRVVRARASEATLCACMSDFIRQTDLEGVLGLPPERVRMVRPAPPQDFPHITPEDVQRLKPAEIQRPFLFYPAGFRPYKNHRALIDALAVLRDRHGDDGFDVVFTGYRRLPDDLQKRVEELELAGRVHVLECVDRATLAALYRTAFATVVPTLYEQGSFPVYEALHYGCPVACSRIPALVEQCREMGQAMVYFDPRNPGSIADAILAIRDDRVGIRDRQRQAAVPLLNRTWKEAAGEWLQVLREAMQESVWRLQLDRQPVEPWPRLEKVPATVPDRREVFLFLPRVYSGGVWEATKDLVRDLVAVNRRRGQLALTLGLHEEQIDSAGLEGIRDLTIRWLRLNPLSRTDAARMLGGVPNWLASRPEHEFVFFNGAAWSALRSDAWLALVDRFHVPLLPARPYGVVVYDMIQHQLPENFDELFFRSVRQGMTPTLRAADLVLVTTPQTQVDVIAGYGLQPQRVRLIPVTCNPERRFGRLQPQRVNRVREPFLLNVTNATRHKGGEVMLRAYARLRQHLGNQTPQLVLCGWDSQQLAPGAAPPVSYWQTIRKLIVELGLEEGRDLAFLGFVSDAELLDLYRRCQAVVNAAIYDNGSFSLVEGAYFDRPVVSSRYPAAEFLCERFGVPARFFRPGDAQDLAAALAQPFPARIDGNRVRQRLQDPELGTLRFAERVYDSLRELAERGRGYWTYRTCA